MCSWTELHGPRARCMITMGTQKTPLTCAFSEPPIGIEPMTYALRAARCTALGALPAQTAAHAFRNALSAHRERGSRSTIRSTSESSLGSRLLLAGRASPLLSRRCPRYGGRSSAHCKDGGCAGARVVDAKDCLGAAATALRAEQRKKAGQVACQRPRSAVLQPRQPAELRPR